MEKKLEEATKIKKRRPINPLSLFLISMGLFIIILTFYAATQGVYDYKFGYLAFLTNLSIGVTEIIVAWLLDTHVH